MAEKRIEDWLNTAVSGIRFKHDRKAVEEELREHLEDKIEDLKRFYHLSREEAEEMALGQMGDAAEIGRAMAKIHRPWWGYLWQVSRIVLGVTLLVAACYGGASVHDAIVSEQSHAEFLEASGKKNQHIMEAFFLEGIDPIGTYMVHRVKGDPLECELVELIETKGSAKARHYRIRVAGAALWDFVMPDGSDSRSLFCDLRAVGLPWEPMSPRVLHYVSAEDSLGNRYPSLSEWYSGNREWEVRNPISINANLDDKPLDFTPFEKMFSFEVHDIHPDAQWLRLEYRVENVAWSLTVPFGKEGER